MIQKVAMSRLTEKLKGMLSGDVFTEDAVLGKYSKDQSIYEIKPQAVVVPANVDDLQKTVLFAANEGLSITPRGGGSGTAGSALGEGIVVAFHPGGFLGRIRDFSSRGNQHFVTAEVGVYHETLQKFLKERGFYLPADPSSARICQLGGNIGTKASGPHALRHGAIDRFLEHIEFISDQGEQVNTDDETSIPVRIREPIRQLADRLAKDTHVRALLLDRKNLKTASGYNLFALLGGLPDGKRISRFFAGSVGTLGLVTKAVLRVEPYEPEKIALLYSFKDLVDAGSAVGLIRETGASAIEIMSRDTVRIIQTKRGNTSDLPSDGHLLFVEFEGTGRFDMLENVRRMIASQKYTLTTSAKIATSPEEIDRLWHVRRQVLPILMQPGSHMKALSVVNDVGVHPADLAPFIADLQRVFKKQKTEAIIYGHAGNGNLHLRPFFDVMKPHLKKRIQSMADAVYDLVFQYKGTITSEHGMGRLRAPYLEKEWGPELFNYMKEAKSIFDPNGLFNPDAMFGKGSITDNIQKELLTVCKD